MRSTKNTTASGSEMCTAPGIRAASNILRSINLLILIAELLNSSLDGMSGRHPLCTRTNHNQPSRPLHAYAPFPFRRCPPQKRVLECTKCSKVLKRPPGVAHHDLLRRHVASGCVEGLRKAKPNKLRCSAKGCRGSEFVKVRSQGKICNNRYIGGRSFARQGLF